MASDHIAAALLPTASRQLSCCGKGLGNTLLGHFLGFMAYRPQFRGTPTTARRCSTDLVLDDARPGVQHVYRAMACWRGLEMQKPSRACSSRRQLKSQHYAEANWRIARELPSPTVAGKHIIYSPPCPACDYAPPQKAAWVVNETSHIMRISNHASLPLNINPVAYHRLFAERSRDVIINTPTCPGFETRHLANNPDHGLSGRRH